MTIFYRATDGALGGVDDVVGVYSTERVVRQFYRDVFSTEELCSLKHSFSEGFILPRVRRSVEGNGTERMCSPNATREVHRGSYFTELNRRYKSDVPRARFPALGTSLCSRWRCTVP